MKTAIQGAVLAVCVACLSFGQAVRAFDVASVKLSQFNNLTGEGARKANLATTPGSLIIRNMNLKSCVQWAYNLKDYQVTGPDWINIQRYDINAKAADPVKDEELRKMLQTLLADRFKLVFHRETKELPVYVLTVARDGSKMKQSEGEGDSTFQPVKGAGKLAVSAGHTSMQQFADILGDPLQRPVVDETGLKGPFDFSIDLSRYLGMDMRPGPAREGEVRREGEGGRGGPDMASVETAVVMALREQLGLQLTPKKAPIEMIVVEKAEKVPTEN